MNLEYRESSDSLYHVLKYPLGNVETFICEGFDNVKLLLRLHKDFGQSTINDYYLLANSKFFSWKVLRKDTHEIRPFLDVISNSDYETSYHTKKELDCLYELKTSLNLYLDWVISSNTFNELELKNIRNKYNGHLIKHWMHMPSNQMNDLDHFTIDYRMSAFKKEVEWSSNDHFMAYLHNTSAKQIRIDFLNFILKKDAWYCQFDKEKELY